MKKIKFLVCLFAVSSLLASSVSFGRGTSPPEESKKSFTDVKYVAVAATQEFEMVLYSCKSIEFETINPAGEVPGKQGLFVLYSPVECSEQPINFNGIKRTGLSDLKKYKIIKGPSKIPDYLFRYSMSFS